MNCGMRYTHGLMAVVAGMLLLLGGCRHRQLVDMGNTHYVRVYVDEDILNVTKGFYDERLERPFFQLPHIMRVMLCNPHSGQVVAERYLQNCDRDEHGYYLDGYVVAPPGDYDVMIYNFGTETTQLRDDGYYNRIEAYTNPVSDQMLARLPQAGDRYSDRDILYDPDHLFVRSQESVHLAPTSHIDTLRDACGDYFRARTVVKSYFLQVKIRGVEWLRSASGLVSGLAPAVRLCDRKLDGELPSMVCFEMQAGHRGQALRAEEEGERAVLYTTFNTFGKLPEVESEIRITFELLRIDGKSMVVTLDLTPKFDSDEGRLHQWLIINHEIVIPPPDKPEEGGGFNPGVDEWEDVESDIII